MLELNHQLLPQAIINDGHSQRAGFIGQKLTVISALKMQLQICGG